MMGMGFPGGERRVPGRQSQKNGTQTGPESQESLASGNTRTKILSESVKVIHHEVFSPTLDTVARSTGLSQISVSYTLPAPFDPTN